MRKRLFIISFCLGFIFVGYKFMIDDRYETVKKVQYNGKNLLVNIDGVYSDKLPTNGNYYLNSYKCSNSHTKVIWDNDSKTLSFSNGTSSAGISCSLNFSKDLLLSDVEQGSYVQYCVGDQCEFNNVNYINDTDMGYCGYKGSSYYKSDSDRKFISNGFRVAYVQSGSVYLISGGAMECSNIHGYDESKLSRYCNKDLTYQGKCDRNSIRLFNEEDFINIINYQYGEEKIKKTGDCLSKLGNSYCGYHNDLIDNGGFYWFNSSNKSGYYFWNADNRTVDSNNQDYDLGIRPVIKLSSSIYVVSGDGTKANPYVISKGSKSC